MVRREQTSPDFVSSSNMCGHSDSSKPSASSSAVWGEGSFGSALDEESPDERFDKGKYLQLRNCTSWHPTPSSQAGFHPHVSYLKNALVEHLLFGSSLQINKQINGNEQLKFWFKKDQPTASTYHIHWFNSGSALSPKHYIYGTLCGYNWSFETPVPPLPCYFYSCIY